MKIGGSISPWMKRQTTIVCTSPASATITVGTAAANIAVTISRLRPSTSAMAPVNGAVSAIASVPAVIIEEISAGPTPNSRESSGSSACGA